MNPRRAFAYASLLLAAGIGSAEASAQMSDEATARVRERLPVYNHEKAEAARARDAEREAEEDVVVLPTMTVIQKQQRKMAEEDLYRNGLYDDQLVRQELSDFDRSLLNRYRLPLFGVSNRIRARERYLERRNREFKDEVARVAFYVEQLDPEEARALRASLNGWK